MTGFHIMTGKNIKAKIQTKDFVNYTECCLLLNGVNIFHHIEQGNSHAEMAQEWALNLRKTLISAGFADE